MDAKPLLIRCQRDTVTPYENVFYRVIADGVIRSEGATILGGDDTAGIAARLMKRETWRTGFFAASFASLGLLTSLVACADDQLHKAAYYGNVDRVRALLQQKNLDRDERDSSGGTPLHAAMFQKNTEIVRLLIEHGFDVNAVGPKNGYTPLHDAVWAGNPDAAAMLLKYGARTDVKGKDGLTPYEKALAEKKPEMVRVLTTPGKLRGP